ncbi:hypothetical protein KSS87_012029 [Heliosperma pusillum]|nr:hypothetical protein KSS87_012029 [Heliosperma pusillum]
MLQTRVTIIDSAHNQSESELGGGGPKDQSSSRRLNIADRLAKIIREMQIRRVSYNTGWLAKIIREMKERRVSHILLPKVNFDLLGGVDAGEMDEVMTAASLQFDWNTIKEATYNFRDDQKLGQGGFGQVYKGILEDGQEIAVKRLSKNSGQGIIEFHTEIVVVAKLQHKNLVKLLGFCLAPMEKILVYEYLPNLSLDHFISDINKRESMVWETRFKIICGVARGLLYLHEDSRLKIIHRDLKPSNILLDEGMNPKIADLGLARLFEVDQTQADTMRIVGTYKVLVAIFQDQRFLEVTRIYNAMTINWKTNGPISIRVMKPYYLFVFSPHEYYLYFLERQVLNIERLLLVLRPASYFTIPDKLLFHIVPLWIRVKGIPFHLMNTSVAAFLLSHVGTVYEEESFPSLLPTRNFVKIRVWIDLSKPLIPGCYLALTKREHAWISFSCEGIFRSCKTCRKIGHLVSFCPFGKVRGVKGIKGRIDKLDDNVLEVLHGPPGTEFYSREIYGLPSSFKYLNSEINYVSGVEEVVIDSGGGSSLYSFSPASSTEEIGVEIFTTPPSEFVVNEDVSREVLLETNSLVREHLPLVGGNFLGESSNHSDADGSGQIPAFRISVSEEDEDVNVSLDLGLAEPEIPNQSSDLDCFSEIGA